MGENSVEWNILMNPDYKLSRLPRIEVAEHPLRSFTVRERIPRKIIGSAPSTGRTTPVSTPVPSTDPLTMALKQLDPLSEFVMQEIDPLSKMAAEMDLCDGQFLKTASSRDSEENPFDKMESWTSRKARILSKYTTSEKLTIITSFLSEGEKVMVKTQSTAVDKVQHRLKQLDSFEEGSQQKLDLFQAEYISKIDQLNNELVSSWNTEQRVKALKIAIQCAKLLTDTDVLPFYPSKFVLITDILDTFGKLVYDRLRVKANYIKPGSKTPIPLPEDFTPGMVPDAAKETCLNWFYKIASIRELVPRLYVEIALLKSYNFISTNECVDSLTRITDMIHGIGNPLVAVYARCYLCKTGISVSNKNSDYGYLFGNFTGFLDSYQHLYSRCVKAELDAQHMPLSTYVTLYTPALDFILEAVACRANDSVLADMLNICKQYKNSSLILNTIMSGFKPTRIAERAMEFLETIIESSDDGIPLYVLLRTLGLCITVCPPPTDQRKQILNIVWKHVSSFIKPDEYIACAEAWVQFVVLHFSNREINTILGDIIDHMTPQRNYEKHYNELKIIIGTVVAHNQDFETLLIMDNFLPLVDLFQQESLRVEVCKNILTSTSSEFKTSDPVITNALMFLCSVLHDSVNALTPEDEYKQIGEILCSVIRRVDYGRDFEHQLNFYVEARGAFSNIDVVLAELVQTFNNLMGNQNMLVLISVNVNTWHYLHSSVIVNQIKQVNTLSVNTRQVIKGIHTRKSGDFVRACAAYCFITIPSIVAEKTRLELYLLSGQVALFNQCLGQADACFQAALALLPELEDVSAKSETFLVPYIRQFLSTLLVVPDNPERGVLNLLRNLLNVMAKLEWNKANCSLGILYVSCLDLLSAMAQEDYVYQVDKVESNDSLYGSDPKFIQEINALCSIIVREVLNLLKDLGICRRQSQIATELFLRVVVRGVSSKSMLVLAMNLWQLSMKHGYADVKYLERTRDYLKSRSIAQNNTNLQQLVDMLVI
ncbi:unnamed protein product [Phaedon cochleariae]|uniref:VPS35 endosomal protein sorting factor-like n=1 Tax=Phaedon cochleariae TaxID=80249 RepID=A0A9N9X220_PHACE|nr:unnamed protein product [Phaedon cochleariae]